MTRALLGLLCLAACTDWGKVKQGYCQSHAGQGDCANAGGGGGTGGGSSPGGGAPGGGSAVGGGNVVPPEPYDGGPPADWAIALGGASDDSVSSVALSSDEAVLAVSGTFTAGIDLGGTSFIGAGGNNALAQFIVQLGADAGTILDGNGVRCGLATSPAAVPMVFTDAGLVSGSNCAAPGAFQLYDRDGIQLTLDGGPLTPGPDPYLLRVGPSPQVQFFGTPESYEPEKQLIGLAVHDKPYFVFAANLPRGAAAFPVDAGTDAGSAPQLARVGAADFVPQQIDLVDCGKTQTVVWEALAADPSGQTIFAMIRSSQQMGSDSCGIIVPGAFQSGSVGNATPGMHRVVFDVSQAGSFSGDRADFGETPADAGPMLLASDSPGTFYFAGTVNGYLQALNFPEPTLVAGSMDIGPKTFTGPHAFRAGAQSTVEFKALTVEPGASANVWLLGTVQGALEDIDGGHILSSYDSLSDAFLLKLSPGTFAPTQKYVLGAPGVSEEGVAVAVKGHHVYVALQVTPGAGGAYAAGGVPLTLPGGRDVVVFRLTVP